MFEKLFFLGRYWNLTNQLLCFQVEFVGNADFYVEDFVFLIFSFSSGIEFMWDRYWGHNISDSILKRASSNNFLILI